MSYKRYTHNPDNLEFCSPCYLCKHPGEMPVRNKQKCSIGTCDWLKCYERFAELEDKFEKARKVDIHYQVPCEPKYAIIRHFGQKKKPLKVAGYYVYGEELLTGEPLICWHWQASMIFEIVEDGFSSEAEAEARLKELKEINNGKEQSI